MLFEQRFWEPIARGEVTVTFRRWKRRQVVPGRRYRTAGGIVEVDALDVIPEAEVTDADARASGYPDATAVLADLRGGPEVALHRVRFHLVDEPDPRTVLAHDAALDEAVLAAIDQRLDRLDRASRHGPWTRATLEQIARQPGVRAGDLADEAGRERLAFKADVRKLKNLGLTLSLEVGYRLSPRGERYVAEIRRR
ncbi:MAG: ASCH domain-containing protein [Acidimicrobiales bacterium]